MWELVDLLQTCKAIRSEGRHVKTVRLNILHWDAAVEIWTHAGRVGERWAELRLCETQQCKRVPGVPSSRVSNFHILCAEGKGGMASILASASAQPALLPISWSRGSVDPPCVHEPIPCQHPWNMGAQFPVVAWPRLVRTPNTSRVFGTRTFVFKPDEMTLYPHALKNTTDRALSYFAIPNLDDIHKQSPLEQLSDAIWWSQHAPRVAWPPDAMRYSNGGLSCPVGHQGPRGATGHTGVATRPFIRPHVPERRLLSVPRQPRQASRHPPQRSRGKHSHR